MFLAFLTWLCLRACMAEGQDAETLLTARVCESAELARVRFVVLAVAAWRALHGQAEAACPSAIEWGTHRCSACRARMRAAGYVRVDGCGSNFWWAPW